MYGLLYLYNMKYILFFYIIFITSSNIKAQKLSIYTNHSLNITAVYPKKGSGFGILYKENYKKNYFPTFGMHVNIWKYFALKSEIGYEERGWYALPGFTIDTTDGGNGNIGLSKWEYYYSFVTLPIMLETKIGKKYQLFGSVGVNIAFRKGGKIITENGQLPLGFIEPETLKPNIDKGIIGGLGVRAMLTQRFFISAEARWYKSYTPIGEGYVDKYFYHKGQIYSLGIGYALLK